MIRIIATHIRNINETFIGITIKIHNLLSYGRE